MTIRFDDDARAKAMQAIQNFFEAELDDEIGELKAALVFDFFVKELGPAIYNRAVADVQAHLQERVAELDEVCYEPPPR